MKSKYKISVLILTVLLLTISACIAESDGAFDSDIRLPALFTDHAVLQRDKPIHVCGWANPSQNISIEIAGNEAKTVSDENGEWSVYLPALPAGGPYDLNVVSDKSVLKVDDILIGDVWICSGQSNMEWPVINANNGKEEVANANYPKIRTFYVPHVYSVSPKQDVDANWQVCSPDTIGGFSAVGYFFGRDLHKNLNVPIGLIGSNWGGTAIEPWISKDGFVSEPKCQKITERVCLMEKDTAAIAKPFVDKMSQWCEKYAPQYAENQGFGNGYANSDYDDASWSTMDIPALWQRQGVSGNGVLWFRKQVEIPEEWIGHDLIVNFGRIDDFDQVYANGENIGNTEAETLYYWMVDSKYTIPAKLVKDKTITIAARVFDVWGNGGIVGPADKMRLYRSDESDSIDLSGEWKYNIEFILPANTPRRPEPSMKPNTEPTGLFKGMISPLINYPIRGAIWYQGESNAHDGYFYRTLMPLLIKDWRNHWKQPDMPFLFVQLANYGPGRPTSFADAPAPRSSHWGLVRESQLLSLSTPKTGMAVTIDIGEVENIHPRNKQDVGLRLALAALAIEYGESVVYSGPIYDHMEIEGDAIRLYFNHIADGLVAKDGPLEWVSIAGQDKKFVWADAVIHGDTVVVRSEDVPNPVAVRYAWENNPQGCNLYNSAGLPASPFRTDNWDNW